MHNCGSWSDRMDIFVNRDTELKLVEETVNALLAKRNFAPSPIIEFCGVGGIGKTTILKKVAQWCNDKNLPYILADANQNLPHFSRDILSQVMKYSSQLMRESEGRDSLSQSIIAAKALLAQGPAAILLDSLDAANDELLKWIEMMLRDLLEENNLFVVLASKKAVYFKNTRSISRMLTPFLLKPFDKDSCEMYLNGVGGPLDPETYNLIFEWTHGYPLAVNVIVQAILQQRLDPRNEQDKKQLLALLTEQVINRGVLANVVQTQGIFDWYRTILSLLSVPRRFNLVLLQNIIEQFAPQYALASSLGYMGWPKRINQMTDVLNWEIPKAGFSVDEPIRHIFLTKLKLEQTEVYYALHSFLAQLNHELAAQVSGSDRVRYLREYLYHWAHNENTQTFPNVLANTLQQIIEGSAESLLQFYEEYVQDEELKEALGKNSTTMMSLMHRELARINREMAVREPMPDCVYYWREFFYSVIYDPVVNDLLLLLQKHVQQMVKEVSPAVSQELYKELMRDDTFSKPLGENFAIFAALIREEFSAEG